MGICSYTVQLIARETLKGPQTRYVCSVQQLHAGSRLSGTYVYASDLVVSCVYLI